MKNFKVTYRSGNGESWIERIYDIDKKEYVSDQDIIDDIENKYQHIIKCHEWERNIWYGSFIVENNVIKDNHEQKELD